MKWLPLVIATSMILNAQTSFSNLVDQYFDEYFALNPTAATAAGFHKPYDSQLESYSRAAFDARVATDEKYLALFAAQPESDERDWVVSHLHSDLLAIQNIRPQTTNPDFYSSGVTQSIFSIMSRNFASPEERLASVIAREEKIPAVFQDARAALQHPPKIYTSVALEQLPGLQSFFAQDVPAAFSKVTDAALLARFNASNTAVIEALKSYEAWIKQDLLPRSDGNFQIGADNFQKKLLYDEMVDIPLDHVLQVGYANLRENQRRLMELCKQIDPKKSPDEIITKFEQDHPAPGELLNSFRNTFSGLISFIQSHQIVTIPSSVRPIVEETPPFMRALTTASMDTLDHMNRLRQKRTSMSLCPRRVGLRRKPKSS